MSFVERIFFSTITGHIVHLIVPPPSSMEHHGYHYCEDLPFIQSRWTDNVPYLVVVLLIFMFGFIGNIVTVAVISCWRKLHTPTFTMIACLAVSDAYSLLSYTLYMYTNVLDFISCYITFDFIYIIMYTLYSMGR